MHAFRNWMSKMGYNGRKVALALDAIGIKYKTSRTPRFMEGDLTKTELMAMSAARAGLKPWTDDYDDHLVRVRGVVEMIETSDPAQSPSS